MSQVNLFNFTFPEYKVKKPIRLIELFSGVGSQAMALRNIGADFEHYRAIDFDKFVMASYNTIHNTDFPVKDITKITGDDLGIVDTDKFEYIMTYSFPCQDLSTAGHGKGMSRDSDTRSGLLWEVERLLNETKELPQVLLMENVPQVIGKNHINDFQKWFNFLKKKGYSNYYKKLNAKDFGVAQNRNRVFMVSILGNYFYEFPEKTQLNKTVKDYLMEEAEERLYVKKEVTKKALLAYKKDMPNSKEAELQLRFVGGIKSKSSLFCVNEPAILRYERTEYGKKIRKKYEQGEVDERMNNMREYNPRPDGLSNTLTTVQKDNLLIEPILMVRGNTTPSKHSAGKVYDVKGLCPTEMYNNNMSVQIMESSYRIRRLAPQEAWRLMGFSDEDFLKAESVCSNSQLYKQAGNSIVVNVLEAIFKQIL